MHDASRGGDGGAESSSSPPVGIGTVIGAREGGGAALPPLSGGSARGCAFESVVRKLFTKVKKLPAEDFWEAPAGSERRKLTCGEYTYLPAVR
jgi:hypothetical protein